MEHAISCAGCQHLREAGELVREYHENGGYLADRMGLMELINKLGELVLDANQEIESVSSRWDKSDCEAGARHQAHTEGF